MTYDSGETVEIANPTGIEVDQGGVTSQATGGTDTGTTSITAQFAAPLFDPVTQFRVTDADAVTFVDGGQTDVPAELTVVINAADLVEVGLGNATHVDVQFDADPDPTSVPANGLEIALPIGGPAVSTAVARTGPGVLRYTFGVTVNTGTAFEIVSVPTFYNGNNYIGPTNGTFPYP